MLAMKHDDRKARYDYLSWPAIMQLRQAEIAVTSAGLIGSVEEHLDCALQHLAAYQFGFDRAKIHNEFTLVHPCAVAMYHVLAAMSALTLPGTPAWLKLDTRHRLLGSLWPAIGKVAEAMTFGADKYGAHNYRLGMDHGRLFSACMRHVVAVLGGDDMDNDSGLAHLAHAGASLLMLLDGVIGGHGLDTRYTVRNRTKGDTVSPPPIPRSADPSVTDRLRAVASELGKARAC